MNPQTVFPVLQPHYNIAPSQNIPAIRAGADGGYQLAFLRWGLIPHWSKASHSDFSTIYTRAEMVDEKPVYREAFRHWRCLIPASGFYEWQRDAGGDKPQPWYIHLKDKSDLSFAGIWEHWEKEGEVIEICRIINNISLRPWPFARTNDRKTDKAGMKAKCLKFLMACFSMNEDYKLYLQQLEVFPAKSGCTIHAYVLMSNWIKFVLRQTVMTCPRYKTIRRYA